MYWNIEGGSYPVLKVELDEGEKVYAEAGALMMMKGNVKVRTEILDLEKDGKLKGLLDALGRKVLAGETIFHNIFEGPGTVWLSPSLPGSIAYVKTEGKCWIVQDYSYLAHHGDLDIDVTWKGPKGLALGDLVWLRICGEGGFWVSSYGEIMEVQLNENDKIIIDNMHFVTLPDDAKWEVKKFGDVKGFIFGGEGYVVEVFGPTKVLVQTRILPPLAAAIARFMPSRWAELFRTRI